MIEPEQPGRVDSDQTYAKRAVRAVSEALLAGLGARHVSVSVNAGEVIRLEVGTDLGPDRAGKDISEVALGPDGSLGILEIEPAAAASGALLGPLVEAMTAVIGWLAADAARRAAERSDAAAEPMRRLLEVGIRARSALEAAEAVAAVAAEVLGFPVGCAYLVDPLGRISDVVTVGAGPDGTQRLRDCLVGRAASPMWRRMIEGPDAGPDLVANTSAPGAVRSGGLAETMGFGSMAGIVLRSSDGPLGLVVCGGPEPRSAWRDGDRQLLSQLALQGTIVVDNARLREAERREASHDSLTGLLNRRGFLEHLAHALEQAETRGTALAVVMLDLNHLKEVNDDRGHHCGDVLLAAVGRRLRRVVPAGDHIGRVGGDEFAIVMTSKAQPAEAASVAGQIIDILAPPIVFEGVEISPSASMGIACFPTHGVTAASLLQMADSAMYQAKRSNLGFSLWDGAEVASSALRGSSDGESAQLV